MPVYMIRDGRLTLLGVIPNGNRFSIKLTNQHNY